MGANCFRERALHSSVATVREDNNGKLDIEEFRRFSRVYFSRLEWPLWRVAAKGFALGCVALLAGEYVLSPVVRRVAGVLIPKLVAKLRKKLSRAVSDTVKARMNINMLKVRFRGRSQATPSEQEEREFRRVERRLRLKKRVKCAKKFAGMGAVGAAAAATGLV